MFTVSSAFESSPMKNSMPVFFKAAAAITLTQIALNALIGLGKKVYPTNRFEEMQPVVSLAAFSIITNRFFKKEYSTFLTAIKIIKAILHIDPLRTSLIENINKLKTPKILLNICECRINDLVSEGKWLLFPKKVTGHFQYLYRRGVVTPIVEELFFRGLIQEGLCRQLPKLILTNIPFIKISAEAVDHPTIKLMRIALSALYFGIAHINNSNHTALFTFLSGIEEAYLHEKIGLSAAVLAHFNWSLMATLSDLSQK